MKLFITYCLHYPKPEQVSCCQVSSTDSVL